LQAVRLAEEFAAPEDIFDIDADGQEDDLGQAGMAAEPAEGATLPHQPMAGAVQAAGITQPTLITTQADAAQHVGAAGTQGTASQVEMVPATQVTPAMRALAAAMSGLTPEQLQAVQQMAAASQLGIMGAGLTPATAQRPAE
jgi:hypothetical protein